MTYPIPVIHLTQQMAGALACERCDNTIQAEGELLQYAEPGYHTEACSCGGRFVWKYAHADQCLNCRKVGWFDTPYPGLCSRRCWLQYQEAKRHAR